MFLNYNYFIPGANANGNHFRACCVSRERKFATSGNIAKDHSLCLEYIKQRRNDLNRGNLGNCTGCQFLVDGAGEDKQQRSFIINSGLPGGSRCNAACIYCDSLENKNQSKCNYGVLDIFEYIRDNVAPQSVYLSYASAEIVLSEYCDEMLNIWEEAGWRGIIFTSGIKYNDKLRHILEVVDGVWLNVSLDCGSAATYKKIKRRNKFDAVLDTIRKYPNDRIELKYCLLEDYNSNEHEICNFLNICTEIQPKFVCLSNNKNENSFSQTKLAAALFFIKQAFSCGIKQINLTLDYFDDFTLQQIKEFALSQSYPNGFVKYEYK
ncbi:MAG: radical SAM protein [Coriobacteriales bacterium]|nr:radical SAM protein [Coriobacteriales bacterium]